MTFFDQVYNKIFSKKPKGVILHEVLKRSESYLKGYHHWKVSDDKKELIEDIREAIYWKAKGIIKSPEIHEFASNLSNGVAITYQPEIRQEHFQYLIDLWSESIRTLNYKISIADIKVTEKENHMETIEKYYLKVKPGPTQPIDQKYGNISIELILIDDIPSIIRLIANTYNDRLYKKPLKFDDLVKILLENEK